MSSTSVGAVPPLNTNLPGTWLPHLLVRAPRASREDVIAKIIVMIGAITTVSPIVAEKEMRARYAAMKDAGVNRYQELAGNDSELVAFICVGEEWFSATGVTEQQVETKTRDAVSAIARLGRAANVTLVIISDTDGGVDNSVIPSELRNNIPERLLAGPATPEVVEHFVPAVCENIAVEEGEALHYSPSSGVTKHPF